jgi:predicted signal transduction protein with EAL and GGDEF domain
MSSIKTPLTFALVLYILLPTLLVSGTYRFVYNIIKENRFGNVGQRVDSRYEAMCLWLRDVRIVARLGGDEFIVLLEEIARIAEEIIADLTKPFCLSQSEDIQIGAGIGISLYPQHGDSPEMLMDHAEFEACLSEVNYD